MLDTTDLLIIPEQLEAQVPCLTNPGLYTDPALDIDMDDDEWVQSTREQQQTRLAAKQAAEARAVAACGSCPMLDQCREWASRLGEDVFGVAGGLTFEERTGEAIEIVDLTARGPLGQVRDDLIERWSAAGISNRTIAQRLGCHQRTVERRKAGLVAGRTVRWTPQEPAETLAIPVPAAIAVPGTAKPAAKRAAHPLIPSRVTAETAAVFDALLDGAQRDRSEIVDSVLHTVPRTVALAKAPAGRTYASEDIKARVGARKFIMNRVDIAVRSGRILEVTTAQGRKLVSLEPTAAAVWATWRAKQAAEAQAQQSLDAGYDSDTTALTA